MRRYMSYSGNQDDMRRFSHTAQVDALVSEWQQMREELEYWKNRALEAENRADKLKSQSEKLFDQLKGYRIASQF